MSLSNSHLSCEICWEHYDLEKRLPKILSCCGKSICKRCLTAITRNNIDPVHKCPWCKLRINTNVKSNVQLLSVLEEETKWEKCPHHDENMKLICMNDKRKLCPYCGIASDCKNHELVHLTSLKPTLDQRLEDLKGDLGRVDSRVDKYDKMLGDHRSEFQKMICESFEKQIYELEQTRAKALMKFNFALNMKRNAVVGGDPSLRTEVQAKIYNHMNFFKAEDPLNVINEDLSGLKTRVDSMVGAQDVEHFEQQLSKMGPLLQQQLEDAFAKPKQDLDLDGLINGLQGGSKYWWEEEVSSFDDQEVEGEVELKNCGLFFDVDETLPKSKIVRCKQGNGTSTLSLEQIKQTQGIMIDSKKIDWNESQLKALESVVSHVPKISEVIFADDLASKSQKLETISNLFSILFKKPKDTEIIWIQMQAKNDFMTFFNMALTEIPLIKQFRINSFDPAISPNNFENFIDQLVRQAPNLQTLFLNFSGTNFSASVLKKIMVAPMSKLERFELDFSKIEYFNDEMLSLLTNNIQAKMPKLRNLRLNVFQTKVSTSFILGLKNQLRNILIITPDSIQPHNTTIGVADINSSFDPFYDSYFDSYYASYTPRRQRTTVRNMRPMAPQNQTQTLNQDQV